MLPGIQLLLSALYDLHTRFVAQRGKNYRLPGHITICQVACPFFAGLLQTRPTAGTFAGNHLNFFVLPLHERPVYGRIYC